MNTCTTQPNVNTSEVELSSTKKERFVFAGGSSGACALKCLCSPKMILIVYLLLLVFMVEPAAAAKKRKAPYQPFNTTNPYEKSWCPNATCDNSPLCAPCNRRFLFIVATPRSGSTTLLRMFNMLPGIRLSGENWGELYMAYKVEKNLHGDNTLKHDLLLQHEDLKDGPFQHNGIPLQSIACPIQQIVYTINPPPVQVQQEVNMPGKPSLEEYDKNTILGLKTIRMHNHPEDKDWNPQRAANFFKKNFPCSRVIVNIRSNLSEQQKASKKKLHTEVTTEQLKENNKFLMAFSKALGRDRAKLIIMEEWTKDQLGVRDEGQEKKKEIQVLNNVLEWLGYEQCQFDALVHENNDKDGGYGYGRDTTTKVKIGKKCHHPGLESDK